jgi:hypothetical protein
MKSNFRYKKVEDTEGNWGKYAVYLRSDNSYIGDVSKCKAIGFARGGWVEYWINHRDDHKYQTREKAAKRLAKLSGVKV